MLELLTKFFYLSSLECEAGDWLSIEFDSSRSPENWRDLDLSMCCRIWISFRSPRFTLKNRLLLFLFSRKWDSRISMIESFSGKMFRDLLP